MVDTAALDRGAARVDQHYPHRTGALEVGVSRVVVWTRPSGAACGISLVTAQTLGRVAAFLPAPSEHTPGRAGTGAAAVIFCHLSDQCNRLRGRSSSLHR